MGVTYWDFTQDFHLLIVMSKRNQSPLSVLSIMVPIRLGEKSKMLTFLQCVYNDALGFPHLALFGAALGRRPGANLRRERGNLISYQDFTGVGRLNREFGCKILPGLISVFKSLMFLRLFLTFISFIDLFIFIFISFISLREFVF